MANDDYWDGDANVDENFFYCARLTLYSNEVA
jgi:hypothetical protein